jgi:transposase
VYCERLHRNPFTRTEAKEVLTVDDYGAIRRARRDGMSIREIAQQFNHSRKTVRHALNHAEPLPTPRTRKRTAPLLGPVESIIDQILVDDETAPRKQRHTAAQVFRRLRDEHAYRGGYAQVQRYVLKHRRRERETFIPLAHLPGQRLEADFGHIYVDFPDGRRQIPFLVTTWAYSNYPFVLALPFERTEAILEGMVAAFSFFGCTPKEVWWDNPKTVATLILLGRQRELHPRYAALASHYAFDPRFCMPARGNEKPDAESTVKAVQRRFATPVPKARDLDELNAYFRQRCEAERERTVQSLFGPFQIGARFAEERASAPSLPLYQFDPCVIRPAAAVDKYQTAAFDGKRYSVPRQFAFQLVTVKGYVNRVTIVAQGQIIATHTRSLGPEPMVLDPLHYLATLSRKPGALDHAPVYRDWKLPACFADFRTELQALHGGLAGDRRFVRVLQLLGEHPLDRVRRALEACVLEHLISAEAVIGRTRSLALIEATSHHPSAAIPGPASSAGIAVPPPDLSRFDRLLGESVNQDSSRNEALSTQDRERSPAGHIAADKLLSDPPSSDGFTSQEMNSQFCEMCTAGRTTVFFA